jgi:putative endonuclease
MKQSNLSPKQKKGKKGEQLVVNFLQKRGFSILDKNIEIHNIGELDIIAIKKGILVFVEVRSLEGGQPIHPFDTLNRLKFKRIIKTSSLYLHNYMVRNRNAVKEVRFDVASVMWGKDGTFKIEYIEKAFEEEYS